MAAKKIEKKKKKEKKKSFAKVDDPFKIIRFVLMTEKAIQNIEIENKLSFIVYRESNKRTIKNSVESAFQTEVVNVNVLNDQKGRKKAIVKFKEDGAAGDIAMRLGML
ncbi:50S ribosomal protein L23 [archaeon]|nr:50S ribosomal protein L23 [archaeon]